MADMGGMMSGGSYGSAMGAASTVVDMVSAILGDVAANKYARPAAYLRHDDVVVEEQHTPDGWKLLALTGGILTLIIGTLIVALRKA